MFQRANVPGSESSKNFRSRERKFQGAKVPGSENSIPWNFRSREQKFLGAKVPVTILASIRVRDRFKVRAELTNLASVSYINQSIFY